ncbi:hypothetical protein [Citrobacter freundii]|uniref:hypothetical protein n=1 Tax=Citrobacter freundii TaxID=546 RepID=UPI00374F8DD4
MSIRTYAVNCNDAWLNTEGDDITGSYVKYKDHQEVVAELQAKCAALAAENAGMKSAIDTTIGWQQSTDPENVESVRMLFDIKTPATDAFLAEVRAQVWIEGNEPAEFGRYWVRYETDIGPQYCSAKWMEYNFCAGSDTNIHKIWLADHSRSINSLKGVTHYTMLPEPIEGGAK